MRLMATILPVMGSQTMPCQWQGLLSDQEMYSELFENWDMNFIRKVLSWFIEREFLHKQNKINN